VAGTVDDDDVLAGSAFEPADEPGDVVPAGVFEDLLREPAMAAASRCRPAVSASCSWRL